MQLARSSFYYRPRVKTSEELKKEADLRDCIEVICLEFPRYGYWRVTKQLQHERWRVNHKRVLRLMRESDLLCRVRRKGVRTTDSRHPFPRYPNLVKGMAVVRPNQVWLADITYIRILTGFMYMAAILDVLRMAISGSDPGRGVMHHSDQGVQYASAEYVEVLKSHGFKISMARVGDPYENAEMESFFKTLKYEEVYLWEYRTPVDVLERLPYFLEEVYEKASLGPELSLSQ
jgi:transposase InsO family protein